MSASKSKLLDEKAPTFTAPPPVYSPVPIVVEDVEAGYAPVAPAPVLAQRQGRRRRCQRCRKCAACCGILVATLVIAAAVWAVLWRPCDSPRFAGPTASFVIGPEDAARGTQFNVTGGAFGAIKYDIGCGRSSSGGSINSTTSAGGAQVTMDIKTFGSSARLRNAIHINKLPDGPYVVVDTPPFFFFGCVRVEATLTVRPADNQTAAKSVGGARLATSATNSRVELVGQACASGAPPLLASLFSSASNGGVRLTAASGDATLLAVAGSLDLHTTNGGIHVDDDNLAVSAGRALRVSSTNGGVRVRALVASPDSEASLSTTNGGVQLVLLAPPAPVDRIDVAASTTNGGIASRVDGGAGKFSIERKRDDKHDMAFSFVRNGAQAPSTAPRVSVQTTNGGVDVSLLDSN